jgi:putative endonuclease
VQTNFSCRGGEIDLIMLEDNPPQTRSYTANTEQLVFVEVRYRKGPCNNMHKHKYVSALESISPQKQKRIILAAEVFLQQHPKYADYFCRFDVCAIQGEKINWLRDAFS